MAYWGVRSQVAGLRSRLCTVMYLRRTRLANEDGSVVEYLQLANNVRQPGGQSKVQVIHNFGRADQVDPEALRRLARSLARLDQPEVAGGHQDELSVERSRRLGGAHVLAALWDRLGIAEQLRTLLRERGFGVDVERVLFALVANRCLEPSSKLACTEWVSQDVVIPGLTSLDVQHCYWAMDFLLENAEVVQERVFFAVANLLNLEVDLLFFDTTSSSPARSSTP